MKGHRFSFRYIMPANISALVGVLAWLFSLTAHAAEASPVAASLGSEGPMPVATEAEVPYQDSKDTHRFNTWLDEAIFTEISPVTAPEVGIALPDDQDH